MDALTARKLIRPFYSEYCHKNCSGFTLCESSHELARFLGYGEGELDGSSLIDLISAEFRVDASDKLSAQISEKGETGFFMPLCKKSGEVIWVLNIGRLLRDADGEYVCGIFAEAEHARELTNYRLGKIEELGIKLQQTETIVNSLTVRAEKDSLTQLFNAGTTRSLAEEYLSAAEKNCAVIIIDVDNFKHINDRYGHMVGDRVMCRAAETIKKLFRSGDIVGRVGGDEFLVLMKDVSDRSIAELRCSQIVKAFSDIKCSEIEGHTLSCSVGAALAPGHGRVYNALFCCADNAMYRAKRSGGNRFIVEE